MSDPGLEVNPNANFYPDVDDVPRLTWVVTSKDGKRQSVSAHMALKPDEDTPAWQFVDKVMSDNGRLVNSLITWVHADEVASVIWQRPDGEEVEMHHGV